MAATPQTPTTATTMGAEDLLTSLVVIGGSIAIGTIIGICAAVIHYGHKEGHW